MAVTPNRSTPQFPAASWLPRPRKKCLGKANLNANRISMISTEYDLGLVDCMSCHFAKEQQRPWALDLSAHTERPKHMSALGHLVSTTQALGSHLHYHPSCSPTRANRTTLTAVAPTVYKVTVEEKRVLFTWPSICFKNASSARKHFGSPPQNFKAKPLNGATHSHKTRTTVITQNV